MFVSAIIVAAGKGSRMAAAKNKVYLNLNGRPILYYTIKAFHDIQEIKEIVIVASKGEIEYCRENIIKRYGFRKATKVVEGGNERQESVYNGLMEIDKKAEIVAIHDGARPLVDEKIIVNAIKEAFIYKAVGVAVPVKDTIKIADENNMVLDTPDRKYLWAIQTPQVFERDLIIAAHKKAINDKFTGTDDTVLVERMGYKVRLIEGDYKNIKITTPEDLIIAEALLKQ